MEGKKTAYLVLDNGDIRSLWYIKKNILWLTRDRAKHYLNYYKWYAFNKTLIDWLDWDTNIVLTEKWNPRICYVCRISDIKYFNEVHKMEWYEEQYVMKLDDMKLDLTIKWKVKSPERIEE